MSAKKRSLPKPRQKAFGPRKRFGQDEDRPALLADEMAVAMAQGKLEEFINSEFKGNEQAKKLALMMMNMGGMIPAVDLPAREKTPAGKPSPGTGKKAEKAVPPAGVSAEVEGAAREGNVKELMRLLAEEHGKRSAGAGAGKEGKPKKKAGAKKISPTPEEKKTIDRIIKIASENNVTVDWVISRALSLYLRDYEMTGRL
jgi:hypothetical protein